MAFDFSNITDEELEAMAAQSAPASEPMPQKPLSEWTDEELEAYASEPTPAPAQSAAHSPRMTREERIAANNRAIETARSQEEPGFLSAAGEAIAEGAKGAARAVKSIGSGIVGMASGAVRLAGTPVRLATGWEGLHRLADTIDSSYENFGADALMSDYGENPDGFGFAAGRFGEKLAGTAGSLAALGGVGKAVGAAGTALKAAGHAKTAAAVANTLPLMFGNDAAVRAYDTARANGRSKAEAASLAGLNGAIHFLGFKAFENKALNKMLGMPAEMEGLMPKWAGEAAEAGGQSFSSLARGVRNGMIKYTLAERGKGALRAGGIMGLQNFLSDPVMQVAEGASIDDIDFSRMLKAGAHGVGEGALMEGALGAAAVLKSPAEARKFIADKIFRGKDYKVVGPDGKPHDEPGLLNSSEGRMMLMKQNPDATERILDIVEHGGMPRPAELDAAFLPPDMTAEELRKFRDDWRKDLLNSAGIDPDARPTPRLGYQINVGERPPSQEWQGAENPGIAFDELVRRGTAGQGRPETSPETTTQERPNETGNRANEAPAQPEQGEVVAPAAGAEIRPVEGAETPREAADARVVEPSKTDGGSQNLTPAEKGGAKPLQAKNKDDFDLADLIGNPDALGNVSDAENREMNRAVVNEMLKPIRDRYAAFRKKAMEDQDFYPGITADAARRNESFDGFLQELRAEISKHKAIIDDWKSRAYKQSNKVVDVASRDEQGETDRVSTNAINEARRRRVIEQEQRQIDKLEKNIFDALGSDYNNMLLKTGEGRAQPAETATATPAPAKPAEAPTVPAESGNAATVVENRDDAEDIERKFREARDMAQDLLNVLHRGRQEQLNLSRERYDGMKSAIADAKPVKIKGVGNGTAGIVKVGDRWRVVDLQSGFYFGDGANKADAIAESERRIGIAKERGDLERIIQEGRDAFTAAMSKYDADTSNSDVAAPKGAKPAEAASRVSGAEPIPDEKPSSDRDYLSETADKLNYDEVIDTDTYSNSDMRAEYKARIGELTDEQVRELAAARRKERAADKKLEELLKGNDDNAIDAADKEWDAAVVELQSVESKLKITESDLIDRIEAKKNPPQKPVPDGKGKMVKPPAEPVKGAAKPVAEAPKTDASATAPAESGNAAPGISADDFVAAHSTTDDKGKRVANKDINIQGEITPPPDYAAKKVKPVKPGDATAALKAVGRNASQDDTRIALKRVHVEGGQMVATDGRRLVVAPAPDGVADGNYDAIGAPIKPTESYVPYPANWRQVVPDVKRHGYRKIGEIANGDAAHGHIAFADETAGKVRRAKGGDLAVLLRVGNAGANPQFAKDVVNTMFALGAERLEVFQAPDFAPVVLKGRNAKGEITGVVMPLRTDGKGDAISEKQTQVKLFSDVANAVSAEGAKSASRTSGAESAVSAPAPTPATQTQTNIPNKKKSSAQESASPSATWTDRGGTTHKLDGFDPPSADNITKGRTVAIRHDNGVLYSGELVGIGPKNVKIKTQSDMYGEQVLTFPKADVVGVKSNRLRRADGTDPLAEKNTTPKTVRKAVYKISSAISNRTGTGVITPEEADGIVRGIVESPETKHNRYRDFFKPLESDAKWHESLGLDSESAKNIRDAFDRVKADADLKKWFPQVDAAVKKANDGRLSKKDAAPLFGKISEGLEKAERMGLSEAANRLREAAEVIRPVAETVEQGDVNKFNYSMKGKKLNNRLGGTDKRGGKTVSLDTKDGTVDVAADGKRGTLDGNRHLIIDGVNGDELTVTMKDAAGKTLATRKMNRAQWSALAKGAVATDGDPANPQKGDLIRRSRSDATDAPQSWTPEAKKPLERVAHALRNVVTVGGKRLKVSFVDRPTDVNGQTRKSIGGVYTGTAADYANRSRQGGVDDGPSLQKIGTGEGSQVYGWGLYGSTVRGVAEGYAKSAKRDKALTQDEDTFQAVKKVLGENVSDDILQATYEGVTGNSDWNEVKAWIKRDAEWDDEIGPEMLSVFRKKESALKKVHEQYAARENIYEQTFFTDRAPGDESHLLKWEEQIGLQKLKDITAALPFEKQKIFRSWLRDSLPYGNRPQHAWGKDVYEALSLTLEGPKSASEFLRDKLGYDGVKYPVGSFGSLYKQDGDKVGWNYVSFRDDNIRVDHKWIDGELRYMRNADGVTVGEYDAARGEIRLYPGATVADVVHEFTHPLVDFARAEAKAGRGELLGKINQIIDAERATWEQPVRDAYKGKSNETILEEIFTHAMGEKGADLFGKSTKTLQGRRWYNRLWEAIKGVWQDFATKMGWNKADLRGLDGMSPEDAAQKILSEMAKGRNFGDAVTDGEGPRNAFAGRKGVSAADDAAYMDAVKRGDMETAQRMVREAARAMPGILLDGEGNPKVVYHGTNKKFTVFDKGKQGYDPGFFFAENRTRPKNGWTKEYAEYYGGNVMPVFLSNPEVLARGEYRVNEPSQIKSADPVTYDDAGNPIPLSQRFNPKNEDIRYSRRVVPPRPAGSRIMDDEQTKLEKFTEKFIDSLAPVKSVQEELGGVKEVTRADGYTDHTKSTDLVAAKDKANGRLEHEVRQHQFRVDDINRDLARAALPKQSTEELVNDFNLYLQCKHAPERNLSVAQDRGDAYTPDYSEGMGQITLPGKNKIGLSENVANRLLKGMRGKYGLKFKMFENAADKVYKMLEADLDRRFDAGRLSAEDYAFYKTRWHGPGGADGKWAHYVPLKTDMERLEPEALNSSTAGMKRNEFMKAQGRGTGDIADSPLAAAVLQTEQGIRGSIKNEVANVEANLVEHAQKQGIPIAEIVPGDEIRRGRTYSFTFADGETVDASGSMRLVENHPEIHLFKRDGKLYAIRYDKGANGRGLAFAKAASGENMGRWGQGLEWIPHMTHLMSAMRTQYSPEFTVSNWLADHLEAAQALVGRYGLKEGGKAFAKTVASEIRNAKDLFRYLNGGQANGYIKEFVEGGGLTKGGVASEGFDAETQKIRSKIEQFRREQKQWRKMSPADLAKSAGRHVADFLSFANELAEYSTRTGLYTALRKQGVPQAEAIKFARDATVNFNRKGTAMPYINGLYMFANASVQGAVRSVQAMRDTHGKELIAALTAIGVAKAVIDNYLGNDDEREAAGGRNARNQSEYDKKHNVGVPIGGGRQIVPLRFRGPYAAVPYLAQTAANVAMGVTSPEDGAKTLVRELGDQVTDIVGGNGIMNDRGEFDGSLIGQSIAPSVADPIVQLATGKDYKGDERRRKSFDKTMPASSNGKRNTGDWYKVAAQTLNRMSGGNEHRKGLVDVAPEDLQLVLEFLGGAPMRDLNNVVSSVNNAVQLAAGGTPERTLSQIPFVRRVVREYPESTSRYYNALEEYERDKAEFKKTTPERRREMKSEKPYLFTGKSLLDGQIERIKELTHLERGEVKVGQKWVEPKTPRTEEQKEKYRKLRLEMQARILKRLGE